MASADKKQQENPSTTSEAIPASPKSEQAGREEQILEFWQKERIFERSLEQTEGKEEFVFYDGPPFATGLPHYGHIVPGTIKDVIPRYQTMRGYHVRRQWGWDCHGLPIENLIEQEQGLSGKRDIEEYGIGNFNRAARDSVMRYDADWKWIIPRLGRWVDMENAYRTMDPDYIESVWWAFKTLYEKDRVYKSFKSMYLCPRCETTLSNMEVSGGYAEIKDLSVIAKFRLEDEPNTSLLAWTTTPWTLPGNTALAVGSKLDYVVVEKPDESSGSPVRFIVAQDKLQEIFGEDSYEVVKTVKGSDLVGKKYTPLFDYYAEQEELENRENGWQVYPAEFVTTEEGTGIVHIAPAFGQDDFDLAREHRLPFIQHVDFQGRFRPEVKDLAGLSVKPQEDPMSTDVQVVKLLAGKDLLFAKEKITHSYPHCWRCDTPLLNYATDSWFVQVSDLRERLVAENKKIGWVPEHVGSSRFGNWLAEARDWPISRSRFWGAPLPVWQCFDCGEIKTVGSVEELKDTPSNKYWIMRHGEAENNTEDVMSADPEHPHHLTEKGRQQAQSSASAFQEKPDLIIVSDFVRTRETAELAAEELGVDAENIITDVRLRELNFGAMHLRPVEDYFNYYPDWSVGFDKRLPEGESYSDVRVRLGELLYELEEKYQNKKILLVTHHTPTWLLLAVAQGLTKEQAVQMRGQQRTFFENAEIRELPFTRLPHNENYELDLHRPYIDEVNIACRCGGRMSRVEEVFDCWFESGSMPFASHHYPFSRETFDPSKQNGFPADFISEGLDQTRGWFNTLLVLSVSLFDRTPYRQVVVNGTVLAPDGTKISKRKKNYPDPMELVNRFGADAVRYALMTSPVVRAEDLAFSEQMVDEVSKKVTGRLFNVLSFWEMYAEGEQISSSYREPTNVLDRWMMARLNEVGRTMTENLDSYRLDKAAREIGVLVEDLSTWYLRRSRERIKQGGEEGRGAIYFLTRSLSCISFLAAPFMPFSADDIYRRLKVHVPELHKQDSVHLEKWPEFDEPEDQLLEDMQMVRDLISEALELRSRRGIKVRQPLKTLGVKQSVPAGYEEIIKEEVNVKEIKTDPALGSPVDLDTEITAELQQEGDIRELVRAVQNLRKKLNLQPSQSAELLVEKGTEPQELLQKAEPELKQIARIEKVTIESELSSGQTVTLSQASPVIALRVMEN